MWAWISLTPTPLGSSAAARETTTSLLCQPASVESGEIVATLVGAMVSSGAGKIGGGTASRPVNSTSTSRRPGRLASSSPTVRVCPAASNQYGLATAVSA